MNEQIYKYLSVLYPNECDSVYTKVKALIEKWKTKKFPQNSWVDQGDILMISYGDSIRSEGKRPLQALKEFMDGEFGGTINLIHLLPMFPYSSDDGFSVIDFREIDPALGTWEDISALGVSYGLMFDAVVNHASAKSSYFEGFVNGNKQYRDFFISADPKADYSSIIRTRLHPLLTPFDTSEGKKYVWTTFSEDQVDFNYRNPKVLLEMLDILICYAQRGARFIRFDAVGYVWKTLGTSCIHLPEAHTIVKLMHSVIETLAPGCLIITETNVPHRDNISYFGNGHDEAAMVYQFPLPPLVYFSFLKGSAEHLSDWAASLEPTSSDTTYFNFLASHDGIGMRPVEDILSAEERELMASEAIARGGEINYRALKDGSKVPYELNLNFIDAVAGDAKDDAERAGKFLAAICILFSMPGMPAIYYHSLLGSRGDREGFLSSGIKRRINRKKLDAAQTLAELRKEGTLRNLVSNGIKHLASVRKKQPAFHPNSPQQVLRLASEVFAILRGEGAEQILALINVSGKEITVIPEALKNYRVTDIAAIEPKDSVFNDNKITLKPWQYRWLKKI